MERRGGRVISSDSTVLAAPAVNTRNVDVVEGVNRSSPLTTSSQAVEGSSSLLDVPAPTLTIPTLDIFGRFQHHRHDFEADWLLLQEDPSSAEAMAPLAAHVAAKLRRHQAQMGAQRTAAAVDRRRGEVAAAAAAASTAVVAGSQSSPSVRAAEPGKSATGDFGTTRKLQHAIAETIAEGHEEDNHQAGGVHDDLDDDGEYVPENRRAPQYTRGKKPGPGGGVDGGTSQNARKNKAIVPLVAATPASESPSPQLLAVPSYCSPDVIVKDSSTAAESSDTTGEREAGEAEAEEELEGLTGDYLNFGASPRTRGQVPGVGDLQATVRLPALSTSRGIPAQGRRRMPSPSVAPEGQERVVVVPLWSITRMKRYRGYCRSSPIIALHQEVTDLVDYLRPTEAEVTMRRFVEKEIGRLVEGLWPEGRVLVYGSMSTHLLLPLSDLDVTLVDVPVAAEEALPLLAKEIADAGLCEGAGPQVILKTKVPLIKFAHKGSLIDVDISVGALDGKRNSECVVQHLRRYPEALPLILVVKYFLLQRGMHEPYHGGLGSYAATLLVVAFLREHPIYTTHPEWRPMTGLGRLLTDFFRMCGQYWSYGRVAVSLSDAMALGTLPSHDGAVAIGVDSGEGDFRPRADLGYSATTRMQSPVSPSSPRGQMGPTQACIEDPIDPSNNAASSLRFFHAISAMFAYAYLALTADFADAVTSEGNSGNDPQRPQPPSPQLASTPSDDDISHRPTLLARIFHVDADMVYRRQAIAHTYERLCSEMPTYMKEVRSFRRDEDAAMLQHNADKVDYSWRVQRLRPCPDADPVCSFPGQRSLTSLEERLALSSLYGSTSSPSSPLVGEGVTAVKRPREGDHKNRQRGAQRNRRDAAALSRSSSSSSSAVSTSDAESNASSVRKDVTKRSSRRHPSRR